MTTSIATAGYGTLLKRGDGGAGAAVQSFKTWGTSNTSFRLKAKPAGAAGNGRSITVVSSGASFVNTSITQTVISITVPTTATVAQTIAWLYQQTGFSTYWDADYNGVGDGSGTMPAQTVTTTAGGSDAAEVFTTITEVKSITGPTRQQAVIETTHMASPNAYREYLASLLDAGEVVFSVNFVNDTSQLGVISDLENRVRRNFQIVFVTSAGTVTYTFAAFIIKFEPDFKIDSAIMGNITFKVTGAITVS